jgi:hypothetical protein
MLNIGYVVTADLLEQRGYLLRGRKDKIEAILDIK